MSERGGVRCFSRINTSKPSGADGLRGRVAKVWRISMVLLQKIFPTAVTHTFYATLVFSCKAKRGVEDATLTMFNLIATHLDTSGILVRGLFTDVSSAFNIIQTDVLIKKLLNVKLNSDIILD